MESEIGQPSTSCERRSLLIRAKSLPTTLGKLPHSLPERRVRDNSDLQDRRLPQLSSAESEALAARVCRVSGRVARWQLDALMEWPASDQLNHFCRSARPRSVMAKREVASSCSP